MSSTQHTDDRATDRPADGPTPATTPLRATSVLPWRDAGWRSPLDVLGLVATVAAFWLVADLTGALAGVALALAWLVVPPVAVVAAGTVVATALVPPGTPLALAAIPFAPLAVLLLATPAGGSRLRRGVVLVSVFAVLAGVGALAFVVAGRTWLAGVALLLAATVGHVSADLMSLSAVEATDE